MVEFFRPAPVNRGIQPIGQARPIAQSRQRGSDTGMGAPASQPTSNRPLPMPRSENAQLASNTPRPQEPRQPQQPQVIPVAVGGYGVPATDNQSGDYPRPAEVIPREGGYESPPINPNPEFEGPITSPGERGDPRPAAPWARLEMLASQSAALGQPLTMSHVLQAQQAGNPALAQAIQRYIAGSGWNYTPTPVGIPAPVTTTPAPQPPVVPIGGQYNAGNQMAYADENRGNMLATPQAGMTPAPAYSNPGFGGTTGQMNPGFTPGMAPTPSMPLPQAPNPYGVVQQAYPRFTNDYASGIRRQAFPRYSTPPQRYSARGSIYTGPTR